MTTISLEQFLTPDEIKRVKILYGKGTTPQVFHTWLREAILVPNMDRINNTLGQEMDAKYLAYAIENILSQENSVDVTKPRKYRTVQKPKDTRSELRKQLELLSEMSLKMEDILSDSGEYDPDGVTDDIRVEIECLTAKIQELL